VEVVDPNLDAKQEAELQAAALHKRQAQEDSKTQVSTITILLP